MPTFVEAAPELVDVVHLMRGRITRIGSKPWAFFNGSDAGERAKLVEAAYRKLYGCRPRFFGGPWREDQNHFDYAIRLD